MSRSDPPPVYLVCGDRGAGKTTFCQVLIEAARISGPDRHIAGILSLKVMGAGGQTAIDALDLATGRRRRLARRARPQTPAEGPVTLHWQFGADVLAWGDGLLRAATPCDLLVVDELGPLEFEYGQGWTSGLAAVDGAAYGAAVVVVRPGLLTPALRRWPRSHEVRITNPAEAGDAARRTAATLPWPEPRV